MRPSRRRLAPIAVAAMLAPALIVWGGDPARAAPPGATVAALAVAGPITSHQYGDGNRGYFADDQGTESASYWRGWSAGVRTGAAQGYAWAMRYSAQPRSGSSMPYDPSSYAPWGGGYGYGMPSGYGYGMPYRGYGYGGGQSFGSWYGQPNYGQSQPYYGYGRPYGDGNYSYGQPYGYGPSYFRSGFANGGGTSSGSFANCEAARASGQAPVRRGSPGYGTHLDSDGDGIGCE